MPLWCAIQHLLTSPQDRVPSLQHTREGEASRMSDEVEVRCPNCGFDLFTEFEYEPAVPERKFLWFKWAAHEARLKLKCTACKHVHYVKPGSIRVTSYSLHNFVTGRTTRII